MIDVDCDAVRIVVSHHTTAAGRFTRAQRAVLNRMKSIAEADVWYLERERKFAADRGTDSLRHIKFARTVSGLFRSYHAARRENESMKEKIKKLEVVRDRLLRDMCKGTS